MPTYTFNKCQLQAKRNLKCRDCGKRFSRSKTFYQTVNPWNKNAEGVPKASHEIYAELDIKSKAWQPEDLCTKCGDAVTEKIGGDS